jgi:hypothetical protein
MAFWWRLAKRRQALAKVRFSGVGGLGDARSRLECCSRFRASHLLDIEPARLSRKTSYNRGPARQFDPIAVRIEDHRNSRHVATCYRRKPLAHTSVAQLIVHRINIRDLERDVAPAARLTGGIDSSGAVFL